eukprot:386786-Pyramimonas_sp.AAC.2
MRFARQRAHRPFKLSPARSLLTSHHSADCARVWCLQSRGAHIAKQQGPRAQPGSSPQGRHYIRTLEERGQGASQGAYIFTIHPQFQSQNEAFDPLS